MYDYKTSWAELEKTGHALERFLEVRDQASRIIKIAGACTLGSMISGISGDSWMTMSCVDKMVELGEIHEVPNPHSSAGQHRLFVGKVMY